MSSDNKNKIGTISFSNLNLNGKKIDFSMINKGNEDIKINAGFKPKIQFSNIITNSKKEDKKTEQDSNINFSNHQNTNSSSGQIKPQNQFRKFVFTPLKQSVNNESGNQDGNKNNFKSDSNINKNSIENQNNTNDNVDDNKNKENQNVKTQIQPKDQFRKIAFDFKSVKQNTVSDSNNVNKGSKNDNNKNQSSFNKFSNKANNGFQKNNNFNNFAKNKQFGGQNTDKNKPNSCIKKFDKNSNFFKKSQVKVKLKNDVKKDFEKQVFKKTTNTGGNVDKYSINGMLKTMSNNIELDTEIDDVLGNVISVKLSGINSANSLQKERKIRVATNKKENKVNFNIPIVREIKIYNNKITLSSLADQMAISVKELNKLLQSEGITFECSQQELQNQVIDGDTAELIASTCGHKVKRLSDTDAENNFINSVKSGRINEKPRAPIVTIMGHVDHGKTTLLDYIRKSSVASGEAGGITQHIGAYRTKVNNQWITFLDTPGHAAFTEMRARGAKITDVIIIVVAADDGIMPQTEEAISHAKNSGCPIIVAINKIDKPDANVEKTKQMLLQYELVPEELGGDVMVVPISAKEGRNIDKLLEAILLQAEMLELKASYEGNPEGFVVEAKMDKKRGALATVIVKEGTLQQGDFIIVGEQYGKIKGMFDENGQMVKQAEPSTPVEILGLNSVPNAGDIFYAVKNEKEVKDIISQRQDKAKKEAQSAKLGTSSADLLSKLKGENGAKKISFIIKADTKGSLEAIVNTLNKFDNDEIKPHIAHSAVGSVNDSDVLLASTCNGFIMTFNTQKADKKVLDEAEKKNVEIRDYKIIYQLFDDVKDILSGKLKPIVKKTIQGHAEVKAIFEISKVGKIAGCLVKDGTICRGANVAIIRNGSVVFETKCDSLKHGKEVVKDIQSGQECGVGLEKIDEVQAGDVLEFFTIKEEKKSFNLL